MAAAFLEMRAHEDRGCLLDFNSYAPNIRRKIEAGYSFCEACGSYVEQHPLGPFVLKICARLKVYDPGNAEPSDRTERKKVFLCYAGADRSQVLGLYGRLHEDGFDPWMDKKDLIGGQDWQMEIRRRINSSDYFVACLSSTFQQRTYGHKEIRLALDVLDTMAEGSIFLIPLRLEDCPIEDRLAGRQWIDLFEPDGYHALLKALRWKGISRAP